MKTVWNTKDIWIRRTVELSAEDIARPEQILLDIYHDEDAEVYINGTLACKRNGFAADYVSVSLTRESAKALRVGKNLIAAHCRNTIGGQNIDIGLSRNLP